MLDIRHRWEFLSPDRLRRGFTTSRQIESTRKTLIKRRLQVKCRKNNVEQKQFLHVQTQLWETNMNQLLRNNCELCALAIFVFILDFTSHPHTSTSFVNVFYDDADSFTASATHSHVMWRMSEHKKDENEWEMIFPRRVRRWDETGRKNNVFFVYAFGCALIAAQRTQWWSWWRTRLILN